MIFRHRPMPFSTHVSWPIPVICLRFGTTYLPKSSFNFFRYCRTNVLQSYVVQHSSDKRWDHSRVLERKGRKEKSVSSFSSCLKVRHAQCWWWSFTVLRSPLKFLSHICERRPNKTKCADVWTELRDICSPTFQTVGDSFKSIHLSDTCKDCLV